MVVLGLVLESEASTSAQKLFWLRQLKLLIWMEVWVKEMGMMGSQQDLSSWVYEDGALVYFFPGVQLEVVKLGHQKEEVNMLVQEQTSWVSYLHSCGHVMSSRGMMRDHVASCGHY